MMEDLFQRALGINSPWFIKSMVFDENTKQLDIEIDFKGGSTFSDINEETGSSKSYKAYDTVKKTWRHLSFFQHDCYFNARVPRIKRDDGSIRMIPPPWSGVVSGFTLLFEALLIQLCKVMPIHNISQLTGVSDYKIWKVLDVYIQAARLNEDVSDVTILGMDETSVAKGHDYRLLLNPHASYTGR